MTEYHVGDRVRIVALDHWRHGQVGEVIDVAGPQYCGDMPIAVLFPDGVTIWPYVQEFTVVSEIAQPAEPDRTDLPDEKFLDAVLALYAGSWVPSGAAIRKVIDQARKIQGAIEP